MRNYTNQANVIKRIAFDGLTIIGDQCVTSPVCMLLTTAKPDEQYVSALKQRCLPNDIITFLRFNDACRKRN
ncbi:hypothetical protein [Enterobacter ludwigii]|uniref:hypothetical protein n=1 Tax=Enterobacter ludwigii TaxID=299767 RepID=UPI001651182E|nr:hypothetical protein [Enterobacter ludwigii]